MASVKLNMTWVVVTKTREPLVMPSRLCSATSVTCEVIADCNPQLAKNRGALGWASFWNTFQQLRRVEVPLAVLKVWSLLVNEVGKEELSSARKTVVSGSLKEVGVLVSVLQVLCFPLLFGWKLMCFSYATKISAWVFKYSTWKVNGLFL